MRHAQSLMLPALVCVLSVAPVHALDPDFRVSQYTHRSWRMQDGSLPDAMYSFAQSRDGYLWLAGATTVFRFDGVRFSPWFPFPETTSAGIDAVFDDGAGGLWVVTDDSVVQLKDGRVAASFEVSGFAIPTPGALDPDGSLWFVRGSTRVKDAPVCRVDDQALKCFGKADGIPIAPVYTLLSDERDGGFWLGGATSLLHWRAGRSKEYPIPALQANDGRHGVISLARDRDGTLWVGILAAGPGLGLGRLVDGVVRPFVAPTFDGSQIAVTKIALDRHGSLWVGTLGRGLFRIRGESVEHFARKDGLTGDTVFSVFEDREGTIWIATSNGIDSFHEPAIVTFSTLEGLPADAAQAVLASRDGVIWVSNAGSLDRIQDGVVSSIGSRQGLPGRQVTALLEDRAGRLWVGVGDGLYVFGSGRWRRIADPPGGPLGLVVGMTEDVDGDIWAECSGKDRRLARIRDLEVAEVFSASEVPSGHTLAPHPDGGIWIGTLNGSLALLRNGAVREFPLNLRGNPVLRQIVVHADGTVLAGSPEGLLGLRNGQVRKLTTKNGLPCDWVITFVQDPGGTWWLQTGCGIVALADVELRRWLEDPAALVRTRHYDVLDGARQEEASFNGATCSPDGRIWFATGVVVQMIDPSKLQRQPGPPPVFIERVFADRKDLGFADGLVVPPLTRSLQIDYASPSLRIPQKVKFRYRLEGYEDDWHEAGTRRQAFYSDLPPGTHSLRIIASSHDGAWDGPGNTLRFTIAPAYYETNWFRGLCALALALLLWGLYRLRLGQLEAQEKKFREALESMPALAFVSRADGDRLFANKGWLEYTGQTANQAIGDGWQAAVHPHDLERLLAGWRAPNITGEPLETDVRFRRGSDGAYRWFHVRVVALRDRRGRVEKWCGVATDVEDRKRAEELEANLAHVNRVNVLGELTASISHELKQPLAATITNARTGLRWLAREQPDVAEARNALHRIVQGAARATEIIDRLRSLYRKAPSQRAWLDANEVISEMVVMLRGAAGRSGVSIRTDLAAGLPRVKADRVQMQQVLMNLMLNGIEAMHDTGGALTVTSGADDGRVMIAVSDTGIGLPEGQAGRIFDAFFTTKPQGSGMGLAISRSILESHGGRLWAMANGGGGATFHLTLPIPAEASQPGA